MYDRKIRVRNSMSRRRSEIKQGSVGLEKEGEDGKPSSVTVTTVVARSCVARPTLTSAKGFC